MTEKNNAMTFEEWWTSKPMYKDLKEAFEATFNAGRIGHLPADRAIEVPDVGEWPEWATAIQTRYVNIPKSDYEDGDYWDRTTGCGGSKALGWTDQWTEIQFIPRPVTEWVPKAGDAVFVNHPQKIRIDCYGVIPVCKVKEILNGYYELEAIPNIAWNVESLKPFSPEKIGLPWSEI